MNICVVTTRNLGGFPVEELWIPSGGYVVKIMSELVEVSPL